jgi:TPR repeat protein
MGRTAAVLALLAAACAAVPAAPVQLQGRVETLEASCARGFATACRDLGRASLLGVGLPRDDRRAAAFVTKACEIGEAASCSDLGVLSALGRGVSQSDVRAAALSRRACDAGFALACSNLGTLIVEGVSRTALRPDEAGEGGPKVARLFRTACDAAVPEGCLNLATALEVGRLTARDLAGAQLAYGRACEAGLGIACHRLALLAADHREARLDVPLRSLQERACRVGIAPACGSLGEPPPAATERTPASRLVEERTSHALGIPGAGGFHPGDLAPAPAGPRRVRDEVRQPPEALQATVPPALRPRLGLDGPSRTGPVEDPPVDLLVDLRRHQLGACYEVARKNPGRRTEVRTAFLVESDGRTSEVRSATEPGDPEVEACATEVVQQWEFPVPDGGLGGPYLVRYAYESAPAGPAPRFADPDGLRPALRQPGCVERKLMVPADYRGTTASVTVKVAVDGSGAPILFHNITPAPDALVGAIAAAVRACDCSAGADERGRPLPLWLTLTVRVEAR